MDMSEETELEAPNQHASSNNTSARERWKNAGKAIIESNFADPAAWESSGSDDAESQNDKSGYKQKAGALTKAARRLVSRVQRKSRYVDGSFELDLTYITPRIIAMSFPASGLEATYRNNVADVAAMLTEKHGDHFMIINVAEKSYESAGMQYQVLDFGWPDHMAPPLERLCGCVQAMDGWNRMDEKNVVVVHCKGGKGRTGVVIAAYMLHARLFDDTELAMEHFAMKRFKSTDRSKTGITQESQRRYVRYFKDVVEGKMEVRDRKLFLESIEMSHVPDFEKGQCRPVIKLLEFPPGTTQALEVMEFPSNIYTGKAVFGPDHEKVLMPANFMIQRGDLLVLCFHRQGKKLVPMFRCQFHTCGIKSKKLVFKKDDLDDTKGKDKQFPEAFTVTFSFNMEKSPPDNSKDNFGAALAKSYATGKWNVAESAAALFDNIRSTPVAPSKDDKKARQKPPPKLSPALTEFKASELQMSDTQRMEVMTLVKEGQLSISDAIDQVLHTENKLKKEKRSHQRSESDGSSSVSTLGLSLTETHVFEQPKSEGTSPILGRKTLPSPLERVETAEGIKKERPARPRHPSDVEPSTKNPFQASSPNPFADGTNTQSFSNGTIQNENPKKDSNPFEAIIEKETQPRKTNPFENLV
eukprot:m.336157 g.336157  ORF g.336157 m.336157 type:complete len:641 (-) comp17773_c0_seq1:1032-2954(-)